MAQAARKAPEVAADRRALAFEYLKLELEIKPQRDRQAELRAALTKIATERGESFREVFDNLGQLSVSGDKASEFKAIVPIVDVKAFDALRADRREKLVADGVVVMERQFSNPSYGRVTPKLF